MIFVLFLIVMKFSSTNTFSPGSQVFSMTKKRRRKKNGESFAIWEMRFFGSDLLHRRWHTLYTIVPEQCGLDKEGNDEGRGKEGMAREMRECLCLCVCVS